MFLHLSVILFTGGSSVQVGSLSRGGGLCPGDGVSIEGVSVQGRGLCPGESAQEVSLSGGLYLWCLCQGGLYPEGSLPRGFCLGCLCPEGSLSGVSLSRGLCPGVTVMETPVTDTPPPYGGRVEGMHPTGMHPCWHLRPFTFAFIRQRWSGLSVATIQWPWYNGGGWILYGWGRVWVHHLSLGSGHRRNGDQQWPGTDGRCQNVHLAVAEFSVHSFAFIYTCQQTRKLGQPLPKVHSTAQWKRNTIGDPGVLEVAGPGFSKRRAGFGLGFQTL